MSELFANIVGSAAAVCKLVNQLGGKVAGVVMLLELGFLDGRKKLPDCEVYSLIKY